MAIYYFFDESGNLDFSDRGSRYYLFGLVSTRDPTPMTVALTELRYRLLGDGLELECFHAAEDTHAVRSQVFDVLDAVGDFSVDLLIADKRRVDTDLREPFAFYSRLAQVLLDTVLRRDSEPDERLVIVTNRIPVHRHLKATEKAFRQAIRSATEGRSFSIVHHASSAHPLLQVADYCTWAVQRKWHRGDGRSYARIAPRIRSVIEVPGGEEGG